MRNLHKNNQLLSFVEESTAEYLSSLNGESKKNIGQVFTPAPIAKFMAAMLDLNKTNISILDPGAGTGILTAALCDRLIHSSSQLKIKVDAYENGERILPYLNNNLLKIRQEFHNTNHSFEFNLLNSDFIKKNSDFINPGSLFSNSDDKPSYDYIISNPPYFKLQKNHPQSLLMRKVVHGQPNIYFFFMAISSILLAENGQLVFITPRSYCSEFF